MKKNLFIINEEERNRILDMHETATQNQYIFEQETSGTTNVASTNPQQPTAPTQQTTTGTTQQTTTGTTKTASTRVATAKCPAGSSKCSETGIKIQVKINDECPADVLNPILTKYPKAATGNVGSLKLKEDGVVGQGTNAAFVACKPHLVPKNQTGGAGTTISGGGSLQPTDAGSATTADQYATLSA